MVKIKLFATARLLIIIFTLLFFILTFNFFFISENSIKKTKDLLKNDKLLECDQWRLWINSVRSCLLNGLSTNSAWYLFDSILSDCIDKEKLRTLGIRVLTNIDDTKLAILESKADTPCTVVTLGIGNNIHAEKTLATAMPQCSFFGADPVPQSGQIYKTVGEYIPFAVSNESWAANGTIKINNTRYIAEMPFVSFDEFLFTMVNKTTIDILFMDLGGYEYNIFGMFFKKDLAKEIIICQITVELHGPPGLYGLTKLSYDNFVYKLIKYTPFVPLWSKEHDRHMKVYLFNGDSKYCVEKYASELC